MAQGANLYSGRANAPFGPPLNATLPTIREPQVLDLSMTLWKALLCILSMARVENEVVNTDLI